MADQFLSSTYSMPSIFKIISDRVKEPEYFASDIAQFADKLLKLSIFYREIPLQGKSNSLHMLLQKSGGTIGYSKRPFRNGGI